MHETHLLLRVILTKHIFHMIVALMKNSFSILSCERQLGLSLATFSMLEFTDDTFDEALFDWLFNPGKYTALISVYIRLYQRRIKSQENC